MYLNGEKITSQKIHSQSSTIDLLKTLINNSGKEIINSELPASSYSKNKNDMLGKIVLPLISLIQENTGEKIGLICKGSSYEFYLKLQTPKTPIHILEKI